MDFLTIFSSPYKKKARKSLLIPKTHPLPQVVKRLYDLKDGMLSLLKHPDEALVDDIGEMWSLECSPRYYVNCWMNMMQHVFDENDALKGILIKDIIEKY